MARPLHIGLVTTAYPPEVDGFATYIRDLAAGLAELGQTVAVLVAGDGPPPEPGPAPDVTVTRVRPPRRAATVALGLPQLAWSVQMRRALGAAHRRRPLDVVEVMNWGGLGFAHAWRRLAPQVVRVTTGIGQVPAAGGRVDRLRAGALERIEAATVRRSDLVIVPARGHWRALPACYGAAGRAPAVVSFGIDVARAAATPAVRSDGACRLLYVGRLSRRKGFDVLMAALPDVVRRAGCDVRLTVVGQDAAPNGRSLWNAARSALDADVLRRVTYLGEVPDAERDAAYAACDVFVAPSRYESFGLMYVEAMAHGVPVVGCRAGGVPEVVADGVTGLLVAPGDPAALTGALLTLIDEPETRRTMAAAARRTAVAAFDRRLMAERTLEEYRRMLRS